MLTISLVSIAALTVLKAANVIIDRVVTDEKDAGSGYPAHVPQWKG
jgi:hypothetical protein